MQEFYAFNADLTNIIALNLLAVSNAAFVAYYETGTARRANSQLKYQQQ
jgi:hypothetical protein